MPDETNTSAVPEMVERVALALAKLMIDATLEASGSPDAMVFSCRDGSLRILRMENPDWPCDDCDSDCGYAAWLKSSE
jgi:hypothetical protein